MNPAIDDSPESIAIDRLRRVMAVFTALLVAATWPLWTSGTDFSQIPWLEWLCQLPLAEGEITLVGNLAVFLLLQFLRIQRTWLRRGLNAYFFLTSVPLLILLDQHRLQPWVWQMLIAATILAVSGTDRRAVRSLRWFTISIYFWSAVSKLDWAFVEGHGQLLIEGLTRSLGLSTALWSAGLRHLLAAALPLGELAVALLLAKTKTRRIGLWAAALMHVGLILTLGPTGLGHERGVLIWNVYFIVNAWLLFGRSEMPTAVAERGRQQQSRRLAGVIVCLAACVLPVFSLVGLWDWWPSWAVYSSRPAIVRMFVREQDIDALPASLVPHVGPPQPLSDRCPVSLDAWSFATRWCPMYPQERYRLAVIAAVAGQAGIDVEVEVHSTPDRWTGRRTTQSLSGKELQQRLQTFWITTCPRRDQFD